MQKPHLCWLCGQTCWALTLCKLHTDAPCGPGCSACSAILEEEAECCLLISIPVNTSPLRETTSWIIFSLSSSLAPTAAGGAGPALLLSPFLPLANHCRAHSSSDFLRADFECSMVLQTTHFTGSGTEKISLQLNQIKYSNESNNYLNLSLDLVILSPWNIIFGL